MNELNIPSAEYIKYPKDYHDIISFAQSKLKKHEDTEQKVMVMPYSLYIQLAVRNLIKDGFINGIKINALNDIEFLRYTKNRSR